LQLCFIIIQKLGIYFIFLNFNLILFHNEKVVFKAFKAEYYLIV